MRRVLAPADLEPLVETWTARLRGQARVAVAEHNSPDLAALILAAPRAGTELALLNARLTTHEQAALLRRLECPLLRTDAPPEPSAASASATALRDDAVHALLFTSGTTGAPKAAQLTVGNLQASARAANEVLGIDRTSRIVCSLPLFHVGGLSTVVRGALAGATLLLHERFDAAAVARDLCEGATHASLVAATLARVLDARDRFPPTVRAVLVGGGALPAPLRDRALAAGLPLLQTYGLTEACSMVTVEREPEGSTAGTPLPGYEVRIAEGEILIRGPAVMRGYLDGPPVQGWFRTGDLGELDARGRLIVHSRRNDLIKSGGENVYPAEVEAALLALPGVREVAVVARDDARWGQVGVAFVAGEAAEGSLRDGLRGRLARFKQPAAYVFLPELPRLASGKIDRTALRNRLA